MLTFPLWWTENGACACPEGPECKSPGKHPIVKDWKAGREYSREDYPQAHWATVTGAAGGVFVVDLDRKPGKDGVASLRELAALHSALPRTATVRTGSGGLHLYFRHPGGVVPNSSGKLGPGIDVRGDGGYVVAPPSGHVSGGFYAWIVDMPPADAPAWLVELVRARVQIPDSTPTQRGHFPAASKAVLEQARAELVEHGRAEEGNGGDLHTFTACALLVHDFALSDDEAWPLLAEWNLTCEPPWDENDLRAKLSGGGKYGKRPYGCRRTLDVVDTARKLIRDWQTGGTGEPGVWDMIGHVRDLVGASCDDTAKHAVIERELYAATGVKPAALALPKVTRAPAPIKQGQILVSTQLHQVADESLRAIAPHVFSRNGVLCEVVKAERTFIADLEPARVVDLMSQSAVYVRNDEAKGTVTMAPPPPVAAILHARRTLPGVRVLEAVTTAPVLLADGTILQTRGYSEQARVYLEPSVDVWVDDAPTRDDAVRAVAVFRDLLGDYELASEADFSSWLAGLLSPLVKAATGNSPSPLVCVSASSPGAGKSLLTEVIARIVTGAGAEIRPYNPRNDDEWSKRLTAFVKAAAPVSVLDNVNGPIGDDALNRLITACTWSDRLLGASEAPPLPVVTTWFATGNNIEPVGDTVRRVLMVRIQVDTERPQERTGFKRPLLAEYALEHRSELLSAALTILRAYHVAGRPAVTMPAWGSFTSWSAYVRAPLIWAGLPDPFLTQQRVAAQVNEAENDAHDFWIAVVGQSDGAPASITMEAERRGASDILGTRDRITPFMLRRFIGRFVDKPRRGKRIRHEGGVYLVEEISR
jgi:hypothetical protein